MFGEQERTTREGADVGGLGDSFSRVCPETGIGVRVSGELISIVGALTLMTVPQMTSHVDSIIIVKRRAQPGSSQK